MSFEDQAKRTLRTLSLTPGWSKLCALRDDCDDETAEAVLDAAAQFAEGALAPVNAIGDREGVKLAAGRVTVPPQFSAAFSHYAADGWLGMDVPEALGGQGLPLTLQTACLPLFERGCMALMMAAGSTRAAAHLLAEVADDAIAAEWCPKLASGEWTATICISEPDAGSDVGRIRTRGALRNGEWEITGEKIWISFGDHDMAEGIGHCLLARTNEQPGTRGLSLFLVPNVIDNTANKVSVSRIEEKLGLHGSPTCAMSFSGAKAVLLGEEGRGLPHLFSMIELMRLQTGCQGVGIASAAADIAEAYAQERHQGGAPDQPAVAIANHPDVKRQLRELREDTEILRAAVLEQATQMDLVRLGAEGADADFVGWMLPLVKNFGAETGFDVANGAIQVLGGAGYTQEWPLEQHMRDARVMSIYEGTTGIQAVDFLTRRLWRDGGRGLNAFFDRARSEIEANIDASARNRKMVLDVLDDFQSLSADMDARKSDSDAGLYRADSYMRAGWCAVSVWLALRIDQVDAIERLADTFAFHRARCR